MDKVLQRLTKREIEVVYFIAQNKSNTEIAKLLCISIHTVKAHVCSILYKLGALGRTQAAIIALKLGYISISDDFKEINISKDILNI